MERRRRSTRRALACLQTALLAAAIVGAQPAPQHDATADFVLPDPAAALPAAAVAGADAIRSEALAAHIAFLASPSLAGRGLGSNGLEAAIEYGAASLMLAGVGPFGDSGAAPDATPSYFQAVTVREIDGYGGVLTIERRDGDSRSSRAFAAGVDCLLPALPPQTIVAPLVYAGYGIREAIAGRDDYRGLDVRGSVVVTVAGVPAGLDWRDPTLRERWSGAPGDDGTRARLAAARERGAVALLVVERDGWAARLADKDAVGERFFLPLEAEPDADDRPPLLRVSPAVGEFLRVGDEARPVSPGRLAGLTATIEVHGRERPVTSRNVLGWIAGSDERLRDEAVVLGAHVDHLGTIGGVVHPGADDNASGVAALLEIARVFAAAQAPPRRSLVFALWTGEEDGHLGSLHYAAHPRWPLARTVAYLNLDMIGHPWLAKEIADLVQGAALPAADEFLARVPASDFVEPGVATWSPELAETLRRAGQGLGLALHLDRTDGRSGGSDYRSFARRNVAFVRFFGNFFPAYHEPGDTADALDPAQVKRVARLAYATAWLLADR